MFECNLISLCSANTTSLVANNNTWWIASIINRYSNHSSENSVEERGWGRSLVCWLGAWNRMWLDDKYTNHDLSFCFFTLPSCFLCIFLSCQIQSHYALAELSQKRFLAHPVLLFWLALYHPKWFPIDLYWGDESISAKYGIIYIRGFKLYWNGVQGKFESKKEK